MLGVAAALVLSAFQSNLVFFFTPSQIAATRRRRDDLFASAGMVEAGSLAREPNSLTVRFRVTDTAQTIPVSYTGLLPDLFKEGKGVVAQGTLGPDGVFHASEVLAKHDENYMPPQAKDAIDYGAQGNDHEKPAPGRERRAMIPELGHFALILALLTAIIQGTLPMLGAAMREPRLDGAGASRGTRAIPAGRARLRLSRVVVRGQRFLGAERREQLEFRAAAALSRGRDLGLARRLAAAVDADARRMELRGNACSRATCRRRCSRG